MSEHNGLVKSWMRVITDNMGITARDPQVRKRLEICASCEYKKGFRCGVCGCPLSARTKYPKQCPKNKW